MKNYPDCLYIGPCSVGSEGTIGRTEDGGKKGGGEPVRMGTHVFAHSRKDGKPGAAYLVINNSETEPTSVELPGDVWRYTLAGKDGNKRAAVMTLNGKDLVLGEGDVLPALEPVVQSAGKVDLAPMTCTFFVL